MNASNSTPNKTITGSDDADSIKNSGAVVKIYAQDGNDTIDNSANLVTISAGAGNDSVNNIGFNVEIYLDAGDDYVYNPWGSGGTDVKVYGGSGKDTIYNNIVNKSSIYGGNDNDSIYNYCASSVLILGDSGNDSIDNYGGNNVTIDGGEGNDSIDSYGSNVVITGGEGNDKITSKRTYNSSDYSKIAGNAGNDRISIGSSGYAAALIQYTYGDGDDTVFGFNSNDTVQITTPKSFETMTGGNDLYFIFDNGSITMKNVTSANVVTIAGGDLTTETTTTSETVTTAASTTTTVTTVTTETVTTTTTTESATTSTPATTSSGGDTIINNINNYYGDYYDMSGNNGTIINQSSIGGDVTNNTTVDNSITIIKEGDTYTYNGGDKVIDNYQQGEVVRLASDYQGIDLNGNSFFVKSSSGQLEIQNSRDKFIGYSAESEVVAYSYVAGSGGTVDGRDKNVAEIFIGGDNANNQIYAGSGGSSLWGGNGGADTLTGGSGYDEFFYAVGSGSDIMQSVGDNDLINLASVNLSQISGVDVSVGQVNINFVDGGSLQVQGGSGVAYRIAEGTFAVNQSTGQWSAR